MYTYRSNNHSCPIFCRCWRLQMLASGMHSYCCYTGCQRLKLLAVCDLTAQLHKAASGAHRCCCRSQAHKPLAARNLASQLHAPVAYKAADVHIQKQSPQLSYCEC
jgi:hypothetical protein